jgi:hypothetical protein
MRFLSRECFSLTHWTGFNLVPHNLFDHKPLGAAGRSVRLKQERRPLRPAFLRWRSILVEPIGIEPTTS